MISEVDISKILEVISDITDSKRELTLDELTEKLGILKKTWIENSFYDFYVDTVGNSVSVGKANLQIIAELEEEIERDPTPQAENRLARARESFKDAKKETLDRLEYLTTERVEYKPPEGFRIELLTRFAEAIEKYWDDDFGRVNIWYESIKRSFYLTNKDSHEDILASLTGKRYTHLDRFIFERQFGTIINYARETLDSIRKLEEIEPILKPEAKKELAEARARFKQLKEEPSKKLIPWINREKEYVPTRRFNPHILTRFAEAIEKYWDTEFVKVDGMYHSLDLYKPNS